MDGTPHFASSCYLFDPLPCKIIVKGWLLLQKVEESVAGTWGLVENLMMGKKKDKKEEKGKLIQSKGLK